MSLFLVGSSDHPQTQSAVSRCTQTVSAASDHCSAHPNTVHSKNYPPATTDSTEHVPAVFLPTWKHQTCVRLFVTAEHRSVTVQAPETSDEPDAKDLSFHSSHHLSPCLRRISRQQARAEGKEAFFFFSSLLLS